MASMARCSRLFGEFSFTHPFCPKSEDRQVFSPLINEAGFVILHCRTVYYTLFRLQLLLQSASVCLNPNPSPLPMDATERPYNLVQMVPACICLPDHLKRA